MIDIITSVDEMNCHRTHHNHPAPASIRDLPLNDVIIRHLYSANKYSHGSTNKPKFTLRVILRKKHKKTENVLDFFA